MEMLTCRNAGIFGAAVSSQKAVRSFCSLFTLSLPVHCSLFTAHLVLSPREEQRQGTKDSRLFFQVFLCVLSILCGARLFSRGDAAFGFKRQNSL
jgi:hypothetical protein